MYRIPSTTILIGALAACALAACGGAAPHAKTSPPPANVAPPPPTRREQVTAQLQAYADKTRAWDPLFAGAFDERAKQLAGTLPTRAQCDYVAVLVPEDRGCDPRDRGCARPADNIYNLEPPPGPRFDPGCPAPTSTVRADAITGPGTISVSSDDGSRLEGCTFAAQLWLLATCP